MAQVILIVGLILSYIASLTVAVLMEDAFGFGIGTRFIPFIIAYSIFSTPMKGLWRRKDIGGMILSIGVLIIIHAVVSFIGSMVLNLSYHIFTIESSFGYIIIETINTGILIGLFYIITSIAASYLKKHYGISDEKVIAELEKDRQTKEQAQEEKKSADKRLKEMIITEDSDDHSSTKDVEFTTNHPDVVLSKMGNYINVKLSIKEIEKQILKILEAASLPADTLMVLSRSANMARRMDVLSSEYYAMVDEVIGADTSAKRNAANMIKPLAMQAMIVSKNAEK
ncbi:MAG: hypothetical protein J6R01_04280 [Alistipes sp.]|nr:hypothetical protein [Alistipes sp.]